ncbi:MAG: translation initiation factor IF-1 [Verrucomicrobiota bacterium]
MHGENVIRAEGTVEEILSERLCRVVLANGHRFYGHLPKRAVVAGVRFAVGEKVMAAMSPCDLSKGRLEWKKE